MSSLSYILQHKIIAILRGLPPGDVPNIAEALYKGGIKIIEVTLNSPQALPLIRELSRVFKNRMLIGAGTILTVEDAQHAIEAGACFIISPALNVDVIKFTKDHDAVSIPGAYTATEIFTAYNNGADIVKIFPAQNPGYIKHILAPLNYIPLMPAGGVDITNIKEFKNAGASAYGIGSALVNTTTIADKEYLQQLEAKAKAFTKAIQ